MIVVRLCGGLGNQLFQYAAARRLAQRHATELVLDLGWYERTPGSNTPRAFELVHYPVKARPATTEEARHCRLYSGRILRRLPLLPRRWRGYRENGYDFDQAVMNLSDDTYLDGYWQSYLYFDDMAARIREELTPYRPAGAQDAELTRSILASNAVSLHVRRGDYVAQKAAATVHGTCTLEYYSAALTYIASRCSDLHFFVFSDDVEWARQNIKPPGQVTIVGHNGPEAAFQDMRLMSLCKHHVIANSSFSWWGAWLNPNQDKIVAAPKTWFADGRFTPTLMPSTWIRL